MASRIFAIRPREIHPFCSSTTGSRIRVSRLAKAFELAAQINDEDHARARCTTTFPPLASKIVGTMRKRTPRASVVREL